MKLFPSYLTLLILATLLGCSVGEGSTKVTQAEYGDRWPFTVPEGVIDCIPRPEGGAGGDVILAVGEDTYAGNGTARSKVRTRLYKDLAGIWRDQPAGNEGKVPIPDELIQKGLRICDTRTGR